MNDRLDPTPTRHTGAGHGHGGHGLMMIACCIPMLAIAVALVLTGVASSSVLAGAIGCTVMMALMMRGMHAGDSHEAGDRLGDTTRDREESKP